LQFFFKAPAAPAASGGSGKSMIEPDLAAASQNLLFAAESLLSRGRLD
jgi:hypothetical protein